MKGFVFNVFYFLGLLGAFAQINNLTEDFLLPSNIVESSGAIIFNNRLITHNDSGGENKLFEVDLTTQQVARTVTISNATNIDWEDITQDDTFIYIGDFGNNNGTRTDLKIYKISKSDYANATNITAEIINFSYSDQTDFTSSPNNTIWDAEALVSLDANQLLVFTKNWVDGNTKAYAIPKTPGTYAVNAQSTVLNAGGLIAGGTFNTASGKLYLVGYTSVLQPFVWVSYGFNINDIFSGSNTQTVLSGLGQEQVEGITFIDDNSYYMTSESFSISVGSFTFMDNAKLMSFSTNDDSLSKTAIELENNVTLYPNPVSRVLRIKSNGVTSVNIFDMQLKQLYQGHDTVIDVSAFKAGVYFVKVQLQGASVVRKLVKY